MDDRRGKRDGHFEGLPGTFKPGDALPAFPEAL